MQDNNNAMVAMSKIAVLMDHFELYCANIERQLGVAVSKLDATAGQVPQQVQRSADSVLGKVPTQIVEHVSQHLSPSVQLFERRLDASHQTLQQGVHAASEALKAIERMHRWLIWKVLGATLGCLLLLTIGGIWLSVHYADVIEQNQLSAEQMRAYNSADVAPCGNRLCARVEPKSGHYGEKGEYVQIRLR